MFLSQQDLCSHPSKRVNYLYYTHFPANPGTTTDYSKTPDMGMVWLEFKPRGFTSIFPSNFKYIVIYAVDLLKQRYDCLIEVVEERSLNQVYDGLPVPKGQDSC